MTLRTDRINQGRAKPAKKAASTGATLPPPPIGHNDAHRDEYLYYMGLLDQVDAELAPIQKKKKKIRQAAADCGINMDRLDWFRKQLNSGVSMKVIWDHIRGFFREADWLGIGPGGIDQDLFETADKKDKAKKDVHEQAHAEGYMAGVMAKNADTCPHDEGTSVWQSWQQGWNEGQGVLKEKFKAHNADYWADKADEEPAVEQ